jgi:uncharacterized protein (DUF1330 family)
MRFVGKFLARGGKAGSLARPPVGQRITVYMFDSPTQAQTWRDAPERKDLAALCPKSSSFRSFIVESCGDCKSRDG